MLRFCRIKHIFFIAAITFTFSCGTGNAWVSSSLKSINPKKCAIAGFDFRDADGAGSMPHIAGEFSDAISLHFLKSGFSVIERSRIDLVLKELQIQQSGITGTEDAIRIGKLANVRFVVFGTGRLDRTGDSWFLNEATVKMIDAETGDTVIMATWSGAGLSPIEVANKIGEEITRQLGL